MEPYHVPRKNVDLGGSGQVGGEVGMVSEDQNFSRTAIMTIRYFFWHTSVLVEYLF